MGEERGLEEDEVKNNIVIYFEDTMKCPFSTLMCVSSGGQISRRTAQDADSFALSGQTKHGGKQGKYEIAKNIASTFTITRPHNIPFNVNIFSWPGWSQPPLL